MKYTEQLKARSRRQQGESVKSIAKELGVSPSSVSRWTSDIVLSHEQAEALAGRVFNGLAAGRQTAAAARRLERMRAQESGREKIIAGASSLYIAGCMLYWAEGAKDQSRLTFVNSDPAMVALFCRFLTECMQVNEERISLRITYYSQQGRAPGVIEEQWLKAAGLAPSSLLSSIIDPGGKENRRQRRHLELGTCCLRVKKSREMVQEIFGAIQAFYGGPGGRWINGLRDQP